MGLIQLADGGKESKYHSVTSEAVDDQYIKASYQKLQDVETGVSLVRNKRVYENWMIPSLQNF